MVFKLVSANDTVLSCFFLFFYFLIPAVKICNPAAEPVMPERILTQEAKPETEIRQTFSCFLLINSFWFILSVK